MLICNVWDVGCGYASITDMVWACERLRDDKNMADKATA
jgi:hypothetical protein